MTKHWMREQKRKARFPGRKMEALRKHSLRAIYLFVFICFVISVMIALKVYVPGRAWLQ